MLFTQFLVEAEDSLPPQESEKPEVVPAAQKPRLELNKPIERQPATPKVDESGPTGFPNSPLANIKRLRNENDKGYHPDLAERESPTRSLEIMNGALDARRYYNEWKQESIDDDPDLNDQDEDDFREQYLDHILYRSGNWEENAPDELDDHYSLWDTVQYYDNEGIIQKHEARQEEIDELYDEDKISEEEYEQRKASIESDEYEARFHPNLMWHMYGGMRSYGNINGYLRDRDYFNDDDDRQMERILKTIEESDDERAVEYAKYDLESFHSSAADGLLYEMGFIDSDSRNNAFTDPERYMVLRYVIDQMMRGMKEDGYRDDAQFYWRGLRKDPFTELKPGQIIRDPGFMSTSKLEDVARRFAKQSNKDSGAVMNIYGGGLRKRYDDGKDPVIGGKNHGEYETVFPPLTELKFLGYNDSTGAYEFDQNGWDRPTMNEEKQPINESKKTHRSSSLQDRMNDFQFEIIRAPQKKYDEFTKGNDHDD